MRRVVIFGCSGSGKSTLARAMGERLGLPVIHLDVLYWKPGWREPADDSAFRAKISAAVADEAWIMEGDFVETLDLRLPRADLVVILRQPPLLCLWRVTRRWLRDRGKTRADLPEGCPETFDWRFLGWIWDFERTSLPRIEAEAARYAVPTITLTGDGAVAAFLAGL